MSPQKKFHNHLKEVRKRTGEIVPFEKKKIEEAIYKALTATDEGGKTLSRELSNRVIRILNRRFKKGEIPSVEEIQDIVEEVLILENLIETSKAYILYREQRRKLRESRIVSEEAVSLVDEYLNEKDWQVKENSNMAFSLQGLNHYVSAYVAKKYWLRKIYPKEVKEAVERGDFHIHNLDILATYCCGWDLYDLLAKGFGGVFGKIQSKPPKHFGSALGQVVNFFYTLQGEGAGAQAFSNFDTLLSPFIRYDNLTLKEVKQSLQEFLFNCNVPTRVGFQCISQDTEILTPSGWKNYQEVKKGDTITTFNLKTKALENKKVSYVFKKRYQGIMYSLCNRIQNQLISPKHRVVRRKFYAEEYSLEPIEEVMKLKSPFIVPIAGENIKPDAKLSDEQIRLMAWIISEGTIEKKSKYRSSYRVSIYQSKAKNRKNYKQIVDLLKYFKFKYLEYKTAALGDDVCRIRLNAESSKIIHQWFGSKENVHFIPEILTNLSQRQSRLFLETYLRGDGSEECKISTTEMNLLDGLQRIIINAGYGFTVLERKPTIGKKNIYVLRIIKHSETYIQKIKKINYKGVIWSVHTENETVIARRQGKVFITGNTPFENITLDLKVPNHFRDLPVIIGGQPQKETYKDFQKEMDILNQALCEVYTDGDASGRVFTFPIPTYNITKDFDWRDPNYDGIWKMTAKYGLAYFSNYINSDMTPEDARSMCCRLRLDNRELYKRGGGLFGANPLTGCYDEKTEVLTKNGWKFFRDLNKNDELFTLTEDNRIELHKPIKVFQYDYEGEMYHFQTRSLDLFVTPNHRMVVDQVISEKRKFVEAKNFDFNNHRIPKQSLWEGEEKEWFILPPIEFTKYGRQGRTLYQVVRNALKIKMDYWLKFFGIWLAEGCIDNEKIAKRHGYRVIITQVNKQNREEIKEVLDKLPFHYYIERDSHFIICNKQLWSYLKQFGNRYVKFIPPEIKELNKRQLKILFDWLVKGDGHIRKTTGQINYWTTSKKLANDLQEIILKLGWLGTLTEQKNKVSKIKGREIKASTLYNIGVQKALHYRLRPSNLRKVYYKGKVYCCEVLNHTLFVRRNGKVSWCGNSIGVVTINLPRLAYLSKTKKEFFQQLTHIMGLAKTSLEVKRKVLEDWTEKGLYPYAKYYLANVKKMRGSYWGNHFSTIGLIGMNEALLNFLGIDIGNKKGVAFASEVLDFMRENLVKYQEETGNLYNLEATPAEGTSYRLALKDKQDFPDIITAGEKEPYYTNSTQLPVNYTDDLFEALKLQDELQTKYSGGTVFHAFLGEAISDPEAVKSLIKLVFEKFRLPYFTLTPTFSICPTHGYIAGEHFICPKCTIEQPCEVYSRVVGYLRPVQQWHKGKQEEFSQRKTFKI